MIGFRDYRYHAHVTSDCTSNCDRLTFTSDPKQVERVPVAQHRDPLRVSWTVVLVLILALLFVFLGSNAAIVAAIGASVKGVGELFVGLRHN